MKAFISGAMTGHENYNRPLFNSVEYTLKKHGWVVLNPATLPIGMEHEDYMAICKKMIDVADAVFFIDGWQDSKGAMEEWEYAIKNDKPRIALDTVKFFQLN